MKRLDRKAELLRRLQMELDIRTQTENEAIRLMENCEFEKAQELLKSLDDSLVREIEKELDQLNANKRQRRNNALKDRNQRPNEPGAWYWKNDKVGWVNQYEEMRALREDIEKGNRELEKCYKLFWPVFILWCIAALARIILCFL